MMVPTKVKLAPMVTKSEPNTPIYTTTSLPEEAPDEWFAMATHKEKLAILTIEMVPLTLKEIAENHSAPTSTQYFSPRLLPLLDRMKFHFSRSMALARCEAENGDFVWHADSPVKSHHPDHVTSDDVMSSLHVEAFLAGIEEIRHPEKDNRVVYRRYWRIIEAPTGLKPEEKLGGVISAGSRMKHHIGKGVKRSVDEQWHTTPKMLIAEFSVRADGTSLAGRMLEDR